MASGCQWSQSTATSTAPFMPRPATVLMAGQVARKSFHYDHPLKPPKSNRLWKLSKLFRNKTFWHPLPK